MILLRYAVILSLGLLTVAGSYFPVIGFHSLRVGLIGIFIILLARQISTGGKILDPNRIIHYFVIFFGAWLIWGGCTALISSPDIVLAVKQLSDIFFMLLFGLVLFGVTGDDWQFAIKSISTTWVVVLVICSSVAIWELATGQHLPSPFAEEMPDYFASRLIVASTFGNPNNFSAFLLLSLPFVLSFYIFCRKCFYKMIGTILIVTVFILIAISASRTGLLGFAVFMLMITAYKRKLLQAVAVLTVLSIFIGLGVTFSFINPDFYENFWVYSKLMSISTGEIDASSGERLHLYLNGLYIALNSFFIGGGPDSFQFLVQLPDMPYTINVPNPHNFLIEVLSQYGLMIMVSFVLLLGYIANIFLTITKNRLIPPENRFVVMGLFAAIPTYIIAGFLNSSYIAQPSHWFFFASIAAIARCVTQSKLQITSFVHLPSTQSRIELMPECDH